MDIIALIILGIVQGATEFLPVSSSGHLVMLGKFFNVPDSLFVSIILHLATLLSILVVLRKEVFALVRRPFCEQSVKLMVATIPTCIIALILMPIIGDAFSGAFLGLSFLTTAIVLFVSERISKKKKMTEELTYRQAFVMGIAQGLAIFPGISRSGATISAGNLSGANREKSAKFSFIMSIPVILLSLVLEVYKIISQGEMISVNILGLVLAFIAAFLVGVLCIKGMLKLTQRAGLGWFSIYLLALAILNIFI
ncbi:MAG: undecaprenyl-diphosphate phosphatase [Acetobacter sp.]|nr:undecaprenyl-diphosphate phosphatase [Acetobacter sp.]